MKNKKSNYTQSALSSKNIFLQPVFPIINIIPLRSTRYSKIGSRKIEQAV